MRGGEEGGEGSRSNGGKGEMQGRQKARRAASYGRGRQGCLELMKLEHTQHCAVASGVGMVGASIILSRASNTRMPIHRHTEPKTNTYLDAGRRRGKGQGQDRSQTQHPLRGGGDGGESLLLGWIEVGEEA